MKSKRAPTVLSAAREKVCQCPFKKGKGALQYSEERRRASLSFAALFPLARHTAAVVPFGHPLVVVTAVLGTVSMAVRVTARLGLDLNKVRNNLEEWDLVEADHGHEEEDKKDGSLGGYHL